MAYDENERLIGMAIETSDGPYAVVTDRKGRDCTGTSTNGLKRQA
jgi:hypothetical protein